MELRGRWLSEISRSFLLSVMDNPHAPVRDDGGRWWGHPRRQGGLEAIQAIVLHTTESDLQRGAMPVAEWQAHRAERPSSYHALTDPNRVVRTVGDVGVAFHVRGYNTRTLGLSFATHHDRWGDSPDLERRMLRNGALQVAHWCRYYDIEPRLVSKTAIDRGARAITYHSRLDPSRRSDPGPNFPAVKFLELVQEALQDTLDPEPEPDWLEALMAGHEQHLEQLAQATSARAQAELMPVLAKMREDFGLKADPHSDAIWAYRVGVRGSHSLVDVAERFDEVMKNQTS